MMEIKLKPVLIKDLVEGYKNEDEEGVVGYGGLLNIRPPYQREFVYEDKERNAVIESIFKNYPLNVMYWVKNSQGGFELLDGQQRTLSICMYAANKFSIKFNGTPRSFENLSSTQKEHFLNYKLDIYLCENGKDEERLEWFRVINIAGKKLTNQELRNANYTGTWVTDAKRWFSKTNCPAHGLGGKYMSGQYKRQEYLETVLKWISEDNIEDYMATHQNDINADIEWQYYQRVIAWVKSLFPSYRKEMAGVKWGLLYNEFSNKQFSSSVLEQKVNMLMNDEDIDNRSGIYEYVLSGREHCLELRAFSPKMRLEAYARQNGICKICGNHFEIEKMEADHITPWSKGGHTVAENCQMLCRECNRRKSNH